ncbi:MAG: RNA polymerase subunit sigma-24 [Planctomycetia bacterium]|nr:RNA polymerase subunit sigma-24 [Planctomycetia bacterium]
MSPDSAFRQLMHRLRRGDQDAAQVVFERYVNRLHGMARRKLHGPVRAKVDPEDVAQSVFKSFFRRQKGGFFQIGSDEDLWALLACITARKCGRLNRFFRKHKRNVGRELTQQLASADSAAVWEVQGEDPTPAEVAQVADLVQSLLASFELPVHRQIIQLRLQGFTQGEIADEVGRAEVTVQLVLRSVRQRLERWMEPELLPT